MSSLSQPAPDAALGRHALGLVAPAPDQVEERRGELVGADPRPLRDERRHERGLQLGGRLLLVLAVVPDVELAAVAPVHEVDERERRDQAEQAEQEQRAGEMVDRLVDPLAVFLVLVCGADLLRNDPVERVPLADDRVVGVRQIGARKEHATLDERVGRDVERAEERALAVDRHVSRHRHGVAPRARDGTLRGDRRGQLAEPLLPLVAPEPDVDVDHVVVGDREPLEPVADARTSAARSWPSSARRRGSRRPCS